MLYITSHADTALEAIGNAIATAVVVAGAGVGFAFAVLAVATVMCAPFALILHFLNKGD